MRKACLAFCVIATPTLARAGDIETNIAGVWARGDGQAKVDIAPCGAALCAINVWIKDPASSEKVGDRLIMTVAPVDAATLKGTAFDPKRRLTYGIEINVASRARMTTRGCVLGGLLCKSVAWSRLN